MTDVRFLDVAQRELDEAVAYYDAERDGLGGRFLVEIVGALDRIRSHPEAWPSFGPNVRRWALLGETQSEPDPVGGCADVVDAGEFRRRWPLAR